MINLFNRSVWPPNFDKPPWGVRRSIYEHIASHIDPDPPGILLEAGFRLPDEPEPDASTVSFAAGAQDGVFGRHFGAEPEEEAVSDLHSALVLACKDASDTNIRALYTGFKDGSAINHIDPLIARIMAEPSLDANRLREIVYWFTTKAADREPVKFSAALLGLLNRHDDSDVFLTLGRHDEFTQYAAVALSNNEIYGEEMLWELAKVTDGWGCISTVERLATTTNSQIKDWLLRHGFKNNIMYEYLACICARAGELHRALEPANIDTELFASATELIRTLIAGEGGPAEGLRDYEHGCTAIRHLLAHGKSRFSTASDFAFLWKLKTRVSKHVSGERKMEQDWSTARATEIIGSIDDILASRDWHSVVTDALENGDRLAFWDARRACENLGIDPWPHFFTRTEAGEDYWWQLMRRADAGRIDDVLALGLQIVPLDTIATGPSNLSGLGREYAPHSALDFILQDLGKFPGKGWAFIEAGLQSPVIRNRNMAMKALAGWGRENWPEGTESMLWSCMKAEPDDKVKTRFADLLAGRDLS